MERESHSTPPYFHLGELQVDTTEDQSRIGLSIQFDKVCYNFEQLSKRLNGHFRKHRKSHKQGELIYGVVGINFFVFYMDKNEHYGFCAFCENPLERMPNAIFDFLELRENISIPKLYSDFIELDETSMRNMHARMKLNIPGFTHELSKF